MGEFAKNWSAEILTAAPMIAPARQHVYPQRVAGEEDALARGAMLLMVRSAAGGTFMATCARGFASKEMPTGVLACPNADEMCAMAGGYAYMVDVTRPESCKQVELRPVVEVHVAVEAGLLLFVGFHGMVAWDAEGERWRSAKLSDEGVRITEIADGLVRGVGWRMMTDREVSFEVDLKSGAVIQSS